MQLIAVNQKVHDALCYGYHKHNLKFKVNKGAVIAYRVIGGFLTEHKWKAYLSSHLREIAQKRGGRENSSESRYSHMIVLIFRGIGNQNNYKAVTMHLTNFN